MPMWLFLNMCIVSHKETFVKSITSVLYKVTVCLFIENVWQILQIALPKINPVFLNSDI
jgi:hypothetical protein